MVPRTETKSLCEFDEFLADPVRRVLLRAGEPVPVTPKAMSILLVLLERPGEVVEKTELLERVWPGVVVTEANLTQNVFSLRKSLGEKATDTRYIQTIPGQGYSFAGEVRRVDRAVTGELPIFVDSQAPPATPPASTETAVAAPAAVSRGWRRPAVVWALTLSLALAGAVVFLGFLRGVGGLAQPPRPSVAVMEIRSLSPDPGLRWMETALAEMLTTELAGGGKMRVIRGEKVTQAMKSLSFPDSGRLGPDELKRLHDLLGADLIVTGRFLPYKDQIRVDLRVLKLPEGEIKASLAEVGQQPALFDLVARTGVRLRAALGVEALSPEQTRQALALRPANEEASSLYIRGLARLRSFDAPGALPLLQKAAESDPSTAVIYTALSRAWAALGYDSRASEVSQKAVQLSRSLPREDRLATQARFHQVSKAWDKASQTYQALWTFYPDDVEYGLQLAECQMMGGHGQEAAATLASLRRLSPSAGEDPRIDLLEARNSRRLYDFVTEQRAAEAAEKKGRRSGNWLIVSQARVYQGDALLQMGKAKEAIALFEEAKALAAKADYQWGVGQALANIAAVLQSQGDLENAERMNRESLKIAQQLGNAVGIASQLFILGNLAQERGELKEALELLEKALRWYEEIGDRVMQLRVLNSIGMALTSRGDLTEARERLERALALTHALGHRAYEARTLDNLGSALTFQGKIHEAWRQHEKALSILSRLEDPGTASTVLAGAADDQARLGDLATAWERSAKALEMKREIGDPLGAGRVLGIRARIAWLRGDLAAARSLGEEQRRIAGETGAKPLAASALQNLGRVAYSAGDLDAAHRFLQEALETSLAVEEALRASEIHLDLASLAFAAGRFGEAALLARQAVGWFHSHGMAGHEARAQSILAESLSVQGLKTPAREAARQARLRLAETEDRPLALALSVRLARFDAAEGRKGEAAQALRQVSEEAMRMGLLTTGLEARLALGEIQRDLGDPEAGPLLASVRRDAEAHGFKRLALLAGRTAAHPSAAKAAR